MAPRPLAVGSGVGGGGRGRVTGVVPVDDVDVAGFDLGVDQGGLLIDDAERRPLNAPSSHVDARLADLDQLTDEERATITNVIDALITKAKLRLITGDAG